MGKFTRIFIIYNPNSTGPSQKNAQELADKLQREHVPQPITLIATEYAGHAEVLAAQLTQKYSRPLLISCSGDGGYHEVVNGALSAAKGKLQPVCAVLPSGNANDHRRAVATQPLWSAVVSEKVVKMDVLLIAIRKDSKQTTRYAHSYIGLGLTPVVASELNRHTLSAFKELLIVIRTFYAHRPVTIRVKKRNESYNSLLFGNINQMAKVLTISQRGRPYDGKFELSAIPAFSKAKVIWKLLQAATVGAKADARLSHYEFQTLKRTPLQLDGEVIQLEAGADVMITLEPLKLRTLI